MKRSFLYVVITAIMFALLEPVSKLAAGQIHPVSLTFMRFLIGGLILLPVSARALRARGASLTVKEHLTMAFLGFLLICVSMLLLQYAVMLGDSPSLVAIIFSCNSVITILLSSLVLGEKITAGRVGGIALCLIGLVICSFRQLNAGGIKSVLLALLSAVSFSIYSVSSKKLMHSLGGTVQLGFSFIYGSIFLLIFLLAGRINPLGGLTAANAGVVAVLGIGVTGIGYLAYLTAMKYGTASTASLAFFVKPIIAPFISFAIAATPFAPEVFGGLIFVVAGSYLVNYAGKS